MDKFGCKHLVGTRICGAISKSPEGVKTRNRFCRSSMKDYCCYMCGEQQFCHISCSYLTKTGNQSQIEDTSDRIKREIQKYQNEIGRLTVLHANGKIGEETFVASTRTLENKIKELNVTKEPPPNLLPDKPFNPRDGVQNDYEFRGSSEPEKPTVLWYLVPFFFGIIGGLVGYVDTKDRDKDMANNLLVFGVVWSLFLFFVSYWLIWVL